VNDFDEEEIDIEEGFEKQNVLQQVFSTFELLESLDDSLSLIGIRTKQCKLRAVCDIIQGKHPQPQVDTVSQMVRMTIQRIKKINLEIVQGILSPWVKSAEEGKRGDNCQNNYIYCDDQVYKNKIESQLATW